MKLKNWLLAAEFAAIIAIFAQLTFPLGPIPLTGQTFAVGLTATVLDKKTTTASIFLYLLLGLIGLPVFAGGNGGVGVVFGPTGGFLVGFLANGLITSLWLEKFGHTYVSAVISNLIGAIVTLFFGTVWLWIALKNPFMQAITAGFIPFIVPGIIKAAAAGFMGQLVYQALVKAKFLPIR